MYYDLLSIPQVAKQLIKELRESAQVQGDAGFCDYETSDAKLQLGLCQVSNLGTDGTASVEAALELIKCAAEMGNKRAEAVLPSLSMAFNLKLGENCQSSMTCGQNTGLSSGGLGSRGQENYSTSYTSTSNSKTMEEELFRRVREADIQRMHAILQQGADPNHLGPSGETALHYASLLHEGTSQRIINILLEYNADPDVRTSQPVSLKRDALLADRMPEGTSPLDWAVIYDNIAAASVLRKQYDSKDRERVSESIARACNHLSPDCLKLFLDNLPPEWGPTEWDHHAHGLTAMYHALRPDIFSRIFHSNLSHGRSLRHRQQMVVRILLDHQASCEMHKEKSFSAIHLVAAYGNHETLRDLLDMEEFKDQINTRSSSDLHCAMPLRDAIIRGQKEPFDVLIEHGAWIRDIGRWGHDCHALHLCAKQLDADLMQYFVKRILEKDPKSLQLKLKNSGGTALHIAAINDNTAMVDLLLLKGSSLLESDLESTTPLGLAVAYRSVQAVERLCSEHVKRKIPLLAHKFGFLDSVFNWEEPEFALRMLMTPGRHDFVKRQTWVATTTSHPLNETSRCSKGAVDIPFSEVSEVILRHLLDHHKGAGTVCFDAFGTLLHRCFIPEAHDTGLEWAVRLGNLYAVEQIAKSKICWIRWRDFLQVAVDQLAMDYRHFTPESTRNKMVEDLRQRATEQFRDLRSKRRRRLLSGMFWKLYYQLYGDLENKIHDDAIDWQTESRNRYLWWRPSLFEFVSWPNTRYQVNVIFLWCFLIPMIAMSARSRVIDGEYGKRGGVLTGFVIMVSTEELMLRLSFVHHRPCLLLFHKT